MGYRMIARVILLCIAIHLQVARCGKSKNDPKRLPMLYKGSKLSLRRKGEVKSKIRHKEEIKDSYSGNVTKRSDDTKGDRTEPINKIIDKLKWFVEHKGRRGSKESVSSKESIESVDTRHVDSYRDMNSEVSKNKLVDSFTDVNAEGSRNKLVDFTDLNLEGSKSSRSFTNEVDDNNSTVTHYIEADFGKEPSTLSGFLNNHKVKKLKMVLPGGHAFNLLNDFDKHSSQDSSSTQRSSDESESTGQSKIDEHNADLDVKEKAESSQHADDVVSLAVKENAGGSKDAVDAVNLDIKEKAESRQHSDEAGSLNYKEKAESGPHGDQDRSSNYKEKDDSGPHGDEKGGSGPRGDEAGSLNVKEKAESGTHVNEAGSLNIKEKAESGPHGDDDGSLNYKEKTESGTHVNEGGSLNVKEKAEGREHGDEAGSLNVKEKDEGREHGDDTKKKADGRQHADEAASLVSKEKGEGGRHGSQFPDSSTKGADDLDTADMKESKESNDITLKNLGAIEFDGEVKMDDDDNKEDGQIQMQAHSNTGGRDNELETMSHDTKSDKEEHMDKITHETRHNKAEKEHVNVEHAAEHDEGQVRHELDREVGSEAQDETKQVHGDSKEEGKEVTSKAIGKEVSPETTGIETSTEREEPSNERKQASHEREERKQASSEREERKEASYEREGKKEPASEREEKKEAFSEKEERKQSTYEREEKKAPPTEKEEKKEDTSERKGRKEAALEKQERKGEHLKKEEKEGLETTGEKDVPPGEINEKEILHKVEDEMSRQNTHDRSTHHEEQKIEPSKEKGNSNKEETSKLRNEEDSPHKQREGKHAEAEHKSSHTVDDESSLGKITGDAPDVVDHNHYMPHETSVSGNFERPSYSDKMTPTNYQPHDQSHYQDNSQRGGLIAPDDKNEHEKGKGVEMFAQGHGCGDTGVVDVHGCMDSVHPVQEYHHAVVPDIQGFHHEAVAPVYQHAQGYHHESVPGYHNVMPSSPCDSAHSDCHNGFHNYHDSYSYSVMHDPPCDNLHNDCHTPCNDCHTPCNDCHTPCNDCHTPCDNCHTHVEPPVCNVTSCKVKRKPDVIKVEFVPEEISITIGNKTKTKALNPSGKIKVQYLPGEPIIEPKPAREDAVARSSKGVVEDKQRVVVNEDTVESMRSEGKPASTEGVVGTVLLNNGRLSGLKNTELAESNSGYYHPVSEKAKKTHQSLNGYETHPYLPFLPKPVNEQHAETREKEESKSEAHYGVVRGDVGKLAEGHVHEYLSHGREDGNERKTADQINSPLAAVGKNERDVNPYYPATYSSSKDTKRGEDTLNREGERLPDMRRPATENTGNDFIRGDEHKRERQNSEVGIETPVHNMLEEKHGRMVTTSHGREDGNERKTADQTNSPLAAVGKNERDDVNPYYQYLSKMMSGYEPKPSLPPFLNKKDTPNPLEGHHLETETRENEVGKEPINNDRMGVPSSSSSGRTESGGRGPPAVPSSDAQEKIDPELTSLGQQYPQAVENDVKSALAQQKSNPVGPSTEVSPATTADPDRVFMGGGSIRPPDPSFTGGPIASPDPTPTVRPPSDPGARGSNTEINPVATHLVEAINSKSVSQEEALQMMNDFVSGNQDMAKAAKNVDGMINQITTQRRQTPGTPDGSLLPMGSTTTLGLPDPIANSPDEVRFFNPSAGGSQLERNTNLFNSGAGINDKVAQEFNPGAGIDDKSTKMFNPGAGGIYGKNPQLFNRVSGIDGKNAQMPNPSASIGDKTAQVFNPDAGLVDKSVQPFSPSDTFVNKEPQMFASRSNGGSGSQNAFLSQPLSKLRQDNDFNPMTTSQSFMGRGEHVPFDNTQQHTESPAGEFTQRGAYIAQDMATGNLRRVGQQPDVVESFRTSDYENSRGKLSQSNIPDNFRPVLDNSFNSNLQKPMSLSSEQHGSEGSYMGGKVSSGVMTNSREGLPQTELMNNFEMPGNARGSNHMRGVGSINHINLPVTPNVRGNSNGEAASMMGIMQNSNMQKHENAVHFYDGDSSRGYPSRGYPSRSNSVVPGMQFMGSRYGEAEAELPQGHIMPLPQDESSKPIGLPDNSEMTSGFSRKFQTPHVANQPRLTHPVKKLESKPVSGARKDNVIADMYADTVFPEDINDIDSLQGSLEGKTLTNFDKLKIIA